MIGVYGLGNVLLRDDGFGPSAVRRLESLYAFPEDVDLKDLGTPGLDLASYLVDLDALVFLDTLNVEGEPGEIFVLQKEDLLRADVQGLRTSSHEAGVREALTAADLLGRGPKEVCLIGVVPACLEDGIGLSPALEAALEPVCRRALAELERLGRVATRRAEPEATGSWWEDTHG
jgi:hydrogenase maturation protease